MRERTRPREIHGGFSRIYSSAYTTRPLIVSHLAEFPETLGREASLFDRETIQEALRSGSIRCPSDRCLVSRSRTPSGAIGPRHFQFANDKLCDSYFPKLHRFFRKDTGRAKITVFITLINYADCILSEHTGLRFLCAIS